ncbi:MAG: hypothetical protein AB7I13_10430 [Vicinamibacterales bacterium]
MLTDDERAEVVVAARSRLKNQVGLRDKADSHYGRQVATLRIGLLEIAIAKLTGQGVMPAAPAFGEERED